MKTGYMPLALGLAVPLVGFILLNSQVPAGDGLFFWFIFYVPILMLTIWSGVGSLRSDTTSRLQKVFAIVGILASISPFLLGIFVRGPGHVIGPF